MKRKGEKEIYKNWADDEIEISINLWVQCDPLSNQKVQEYHNEDTRSKRFQFTQNKLSEQFSEYV